MVNPHCSNGNASYVRWRHGRLQGHPRLHCETRVLSAQRFLECLDAELANDAVLTASGALNTCCGALHTGFGSFK